jgi:hypothetical protein
MPDGRFPRRGLVDRLRREGDFNELFFLGHAVSMGHRSIRPNCRSIIGRFAQSRRWISGFYRWTIDRLTLRVYDSAE